MSSTPELILYGKDDCSLCDRLESLLEPVIAAHCDRATIVVTKRNILDDAEWTLAYRYRIPVLMYRDEVVIEGRPTADEVAAAIQRVLARHDVAASKVAPRPTVYLPTRGSPCILFERLHMDVRSLEAARSAGSYSELARIVAMEPAQVIAELTASGLRTRDERGVPSGELLASARATCDVLSVSILTADGASAADEELLSRDPHRVIEGAIIAVHTAGAGRIELNVPSSMSLAFDHARHAAAEAREAELFSRADGGAVGRWNIVIQQQSPDTAHGRTFHLNVETLCNIPRIMYRSAAAFAKYGHKQSRGTMAVTLSGDVRAAGLYEVECGTTIRAIIEELGEGPTHPGEITARVGHATAATLTGDQLDTPLDYEAIARVGGRIGPACVQVSISGEADPVGIESSPSTS